MVAGASPASFPWRSRSADPWLECWLPLVKDLRSPFPAEAAGAGVVVASLSLHYFSCAW